MIPILEFPDTAKAVSQEATKLKEEVQGHDDLVNEAADLSELYDLAAEDEDTSFTGEIERQYYRLVKELEKKRSSFAPFRRIRFL